MMRTKLFILAASLFMLSSLLFTPQQAMAIPAFARQTGMACNTCHFQHFPTLNPFGRDFKAGGYTMAGGQSMIEGEFLSIPATLNASLVTKIRFQKRNGDPGDPAATGDSIELSKGQLQFPDEAAVLVGGRAGGHAGFLLEASLKEGDPLFTSFKVPFVFAAGNARINVIPFTTDTSGPAYGFELLNTGALRIQKPLEHRVETSAQQYVGTATKATGIATVAAANLWFVNYTLWANEHPSDTGSSIASGPYLHYARAAFTPAIAGWDLGFGGQWWGGTEKNVESGIVTRKSADAWALDAQAQGSAGSLPIGVYLTYARAAKTGGGEEVNIFNSSTDRSKNAWTITGEVGVIPGRLTASAAFRNGHSGAAGNDTDNATTLGLVYNATQNMQVQVNHSMYTGEAKPGPAQGNILTTVMLFAAF